MARRVSLSQYKSMLRQAESKRRQTIQKFNSAIRQYNTARKQEIDAYNREVRAHNSRVRANRTRLQSALNRLGQQRNTTRYGALHKSVSTLSVAYRRLENVDTDPYVADIAEQEAANSVAVLNDLLDDTADSQVSDEELKNTKIANELAVISRDLDRRWLGAIFALNPENPDAARHFCISTREIITEILDIRAPDDDVFIRFPDCPTTQRGTPSRRAKIHYCLDRSNLANDELENFINVNIKNVVILFKELNSGAHGPAGRFSRQQLMSIKTRVEDAIRFICEIVNPDGTSWE